MRRSEVVAVTLLAAALALALAFLRRRPCYGTERYDDSDDVPGVPNCPRARDGYPFWGDKPWNTGLCCRKTWSDKASCVPPGGPPASGSCPKAPQGYPYWGEDEDTAGSCCKRPWSSARACVPAR